MIIITVLFGYHRPVPTFSLEELLKGPLAQDDSHLVQFIKEQYINLPATSDSQYQFNYVRHSWLNMKNSPSSGVE